MRKLIIHRERALAAFALPYRVMQDRDYNAFTEQLAAGEDLRSDCDATLRNGQSCTLPLSEDGGRFFAAVYLESRNVLTEEVVLPAGTEDQEYTIVTDFDHYLGLSLRVMPTAERNISE